MVSLEQLLLLLLVYQFMDKKGKFIYTVYTYTQASVCTVAVNKMKANYRVTCHTMVSVQVN